MIPNQSKNNGLKKMNGQLVEINRKIIIIQRVWIEIRRNSKIARKLVKKIDSKEKEIKSSNEKILKTYLVFKNLITVKLRKKTE